MNLIPTAVVGIDILDFGLTKEMLNFEFSRNETADARRLTQIFWLQREFKEFGRGGGGLREFNIFSPELTRILITTAAVEKDQPQKSTKNTKKQRI